MQSKYSRFDSLAYFKDRPLLYIYDSYHIDPSDWTRLLSSQSEDALSIRGTAMDCFIIGLWLDANHGQQMVSSGQFLFYLFCYVSVDFCKDHIWIWFRFCCHYHWSCAFCYPICLGFDGVYSYFASDGFSFGSSTRNWKDMTRLCYANKMVCSLSVGPGYNDTKIRPWNAANTKSRK